MTIYIDPCPLPEWARNESLLFADHDELVAFVERVFPEKTHEIRDSFCALRTADEYERAVTNGVIKYSVVSWVMKRIVGCINGENNN